MAFYEVLSKYYDDIFIKDINTVNFLKECLEDKSSILDIACGTGTYAIALASLGYNVTGVDLDKAMIEKAKSKNNVKDIIFMEGNMLKLPSEIENSRYDLIYCIGNSIVHLDNIKEIERVIIKFNEMLKNNGTIILQIINYDRIINKNINSLPTIKRENIGVDFIREYDYDKDNFKVIFKGTIVEHSAGTRDEKCYSNEVLLTPILSGQLITILKNNNFKDIELYGGFNKSEYNEDSYSLVVRAKK